MSSNDKGRPAHIPENAPIRMKLQIGSGIVEIAFTSTQVRELGGVLPACNNAYTTCMQAHAKMAPETPA